VQDIYQDRTGFLWVSTQEGVYRYDGDRFHRWGSFRGLPDMSGASFAEAADGTLLVGGSKGVFRLTGGSFQMVPLPGDPQVSWLHGMQADTSGHVYVATTLGLMVLSGGREGFSVRAVPNPHQVTGRDAWSVFVDGNQIWYGCGRQLCDLTAGRARVFGSSSGLPAALWLPIGRDLHGNLWVKDWGPDIRVLPAGASSFRAARSPIPGEGLAGVPATDGNGFIVFPSPDGLLIRRRDDWWRIDRTSGLLGTPYSVFRDREGSLWIGLEGQGLVRWAGYRQWEAYTAASGFASNIAYQILTGRDGAIWVGSDSGLFRGTPKGQSYVWHRVAGVRKTPIISMAFDDNGRLWLGTEMNGLARFDPENGALRWIRQPGFSAVYVADLTTDRQKRLWAATDDGIYLADPPYRKFTHVKGLPNSRFWTVVQAANGDIWAGGAEGLYHLTGSNWRRFTTVDGLSRKEVVALAATSDGAIWVGYRTGGEIDRIDPANGSIRITHDRRLARDGVRIVYFFGFDRSGRMWAGTNRGVGVLEHGRWTRMGSNDGLIWDDCDSNGFASAADGSVWIGTSNGLAHFTPAQFHPAQPSAVVFTRLALGGKTVSAAAQQPSVDYRSNSFVVQYSSLDLAHGGAVSYQYRLLPLFSAWRTSTRNELEFPGLPPGIYVFEAKVHDRLGQVQTPVAQFAFQVRTPWFRSWWFEALAVLAALCLLVLMVKLRLAALKRREAELMWLVEERTADLKQANDELYRLSSIDDLTGIANRRVCDDLLRREWARMNRSGEPLSAMMLDADHFKILNDAEGHPRGDQYLIRLAQELRNLVKRETDLAARYGGEEFVVVLPATGALEAEQFAESLRASIENLGLPHPSSPAAPVLTISIGVGTALPGSFNHVSAFMAAIDRALYVAKARGRNRVISIAQLQREQSCSESLADAVIRIKSDE
jgi:diguanylate cyclase (GGDEF)-like protein